LRKEDALYVVRMKILYIVKMFGNEEVGGRAFEEEIAYC
jgi:hypothetical protein